uniref:Uncharacterized protein n=1 Tax=Metapenaeus joyneri majanivirus TaxID=2984280 RepID=A0A9C7EYS8_9VIRU|nr:MAG: hypothetical protein [Metapenaeus joyneri majanivirus]
METENKNTFSSLEPSIKTPDDILPFLNDDDRLMFKKVPPWEEEELGNLITKIPINCMNIDRVYCLQYTTDYDMTDHIEFCHFYGRFKICSSSSSYPQHLYIKYKGQKNRLNNLNKFDFNGGIYITANPQLFFDMLTTNTVPSDICNYNTIKELMINDGVQLIEPQLGSFKCLVSNFDNSKMFMFKDFNNYTRYKIQILHWELNNVWYIRNAQFKDFDRLYYIYDNNNIFDYSNSSSSSSSSSSNSSSSNRSSSSSSSIKTGTGHYELLGRIKPGYNHRHRKPLYVHIKIDYCSKSKTLIDESVFLTANPHSFFSHITHSYKPRPYYHNHAKVVSFNFDEILKSMREDGILIEQPSFKTTFSAVPQSIVTSQDLFSEGSLGHDILTHQDRLPIYKKYNNNDDKDVWDKNISINPHTVKRVYYIHSGKDADNKWQYYIFCGMLRSSNYHHYNNYHDDDDDDDDEQNRDTKEGGKRKRRKKKKGGEKEEIKKEKKRERRWKKERTPLYITLLSRKKNKKYPYQTQEKPVIIEGSINVFIDPQKFLNHISSLHHRHTKYYIPMAMSTINTICTSMRKDGILVNKPSLSGIFKSLVERIKHPDDLICKDPEWQYILDYQSKYIKNFIPKEIKKKFKHTMSDIKISPQTLERVYCILSKDNDDYYEFWGRIKSPSSGSRNRYCYGSDSSSSSYSYYNSSSSSSSSSSNSSICYNDPSHDQKLRLPLYVVLRVQGIHYDISSCKMYEAPHIRGVIDIFVDPQIFLDNLFMSFDYEYCYSASDDNIDNVWNSLKEDGILVTKPSLAVFKSLIPEITNLEDAIDTNFKDLAFILKYQNKFEKEISPWEIDNFRDVPNININPQTVNSLYYYDYIQVHEYKRNYIFLGRLVSNYHHIHRKPLYVKLEAESYSYKKCGMKNYDLSGTIYITDNPQYFLNFITYSNKQYDYYDCEKIWKSIKEDNINISKPTPMTFKSLVPSIETLDTLYKDRVLWEIDDYQNNFQKEVSLIDNNDDDQVRNKDLNDLVIHSKNIDRYYYSSYKDEKKVFNFYQLLARLLPNHFYSKDGKPLYVYLEAYKDFDGSYSNGIIYVTTSPHIFLNVMVFNTKNIESETIYNLMKEDGISVVKPSILEALMREYVCEMNNDDDDDKNKEEKSTDHHSSQEEEEEKKTSVCNLQSLCCKSIYDEKHHEVEDFFNDTNTFPILLKKKYRNYIKYHEIPKIIKERHYQMEKIEFARKNLSQQERRSLLMKLSALNNDTI